MLRNRKKALRIGLAALGIAAAGGYAYYRLAYLPGRGQEEPAIVTAEVRLGDVVISVSGSGTLVPAAEADLGFGAAGYVAEVLVQPGDQVSAGQVLARLDSAELQLAVDEADIKARQAQMSLDELLAGPTDAEVAQARMSYESALVSLQVAENNYDSALNSSLDAAANSNRMHLDWYSAEYWRLQSGGASAGEIEQAYSNMAQAEARFNDSVRQADLEQLEAENRLEQAKDRARDAQESLADVLDGTTSDEIARAQLAADRAALALADAAAALEGAEICAPFDGLVLDVSAVEGERVGAGPVVTLIGMQHPLVQFWVEEADASGVAVGYRVDIYPEALPDDIFSGEVVAVDPELVNVDGVLAVQAWASVDVPAGQRLLAGMNAYLDVVAAEARDVMLVPVEALRQLGEDSYAVFVVRQDGELELRVVGMGLYNYVYAEITSGLELGETVSAGVEERTGTTIPEFQMPGEGIILSPGGGGGFVVGPGRDGRSIER
jgi:HlyD family secretion protein